MASTHSPPKNNDRKLKSSSKSSISSGNDSSKSCSNCLDLQNTVTLQKEKLSTLELKIRDCVRAYKQVLTEKNLIQEALELDRNNSRSTEDEQRYAKLESNLAELSFICGKYEAENHKNTSIIDDLTRKCHDLQEKLLTYENTSHMNLDFSCTEMKHKHKWTQTEIYIDLRLQKENMLAIEAIDEKSPSMIDISVQTETDFEDQNRPREKEKAIVVPTQRDTTGSFEDSSESFKSDSESTFSDLEHLVTDIPSSRHKQSIGSVSTINQEVESNSVSIFYVNELARKEIELAECRLLAREHECALREIRWKYNVDTYKLQNRVNQLENQLKHMQTDDTQKPNIMYIRNVLIRFLKTKDKNQKTFMMNALLTAIGADPKEIKN